MNTKEYVEDHFKNHTAKLNNLGNIKILDFQEGNLFDHRIRFLFEEDYYRLHISGDLGELTACNYKNMTFEHFQDHFCENVGYFMEKVQCMSREMYLYSESEARKTLIEYLFDEEVGRRQEDLSDEEREDLEEIMSFFLDDHGFNHSSIFQNTPYTLIDRNIDYWEWIGSCGRDYNPVIQIYLEAFKLAVSRLEEEGAI